MATMPLLTPTESLKFQSALLDYSNSITASEWAVYTGDMPEDYGNHHLPPPKESNDALTKATKDLMSLDTSSIRWNESADRDVLSSDLPATSSNISFKPIAPSSFPLHSPLHRITSPLHQIFGSPVSSPQRSPLTIVPSRTSDNSAASDSQQSLSSVSSDPTPPPPTPPNLKRPYPSSSDLSHLSAPIASGSRSQAAASSSRQQSKKHRASPPNGRGQVINSKPSLLSVSQKKANHIQSEQKRRANIRRGYEALCETVPALREAIAAEEQELAEETGEGYDDSSRGKNKKKGRAKRSLSESGEKMDGRAGPRSENIVLQKTIEYIHDLLEERKMLLDRLSRGRSRLAPGHSALVPLQGAPPLWEREWTGGTGILDDDDSDGDEES